MSQVCRCLLIDWLILDIFMRPCRLHVTGRQASVLVCVTYVLVCRYVSYSMCYDMSQVASVYVGRCWLSQMCKCLWLNVGLNGSAYMTSLRLWWCWDFVIFVCCSLLLVPVQSRWCWLMAMSTQSAVSTDFYITVAAVSTQSAESADFYITVTAVSTQQ